MFTKDYDRTFSEPLKLESRRWSMAAAAFFALWAMLLLAPILLTIAAPLLGFGMLYLLKDLEKDADKSNIWVSLAMVALALAMPTLMMLAGLGVIATPIVGLIFAATMLVASVVYAIRRFKEFNNNKTGTWIAIAGLSVMVLGTIMLSLAMFGVFTAPLWMLCGLVGLFSMLPAYHHIKQYNDDDKQDQSIWAKLNPLNILPVLKKYGPMMLSVGILPLAFLVFPAFAMLIFAFFLVAALGFTAYSAIRSAQSDRNVTSIPEDTLTRFKQELFLGINNENKSAYDAACTAYKEILEYCRKFNKEFDPFKASDAATFYAQTLHPALASPDAKRGKELEYKRYEGITPERIYFQLDSETSRARSIGSLLDHSGPIDQKESKLSSNSQQTEQPLDRKHNAGEPSVERSSESSTDLTDDQSRSTDAKGTKTRRSASFLGSPATTAPLRVTEKQDAKLVARIENLQTKNKSLIEQLQKATQEAKKSHEALEAIQQKMQTVQSESKKLSREHKVLQKSAAKAQKELATLRGWWQAEKKTLGALQKKVSSLTRQLERNKEALIKTKAETAIFRNENKQLRKLAAEAQAALKSLRKKNAHPIKDAKDIKSLRGTLKAQKDELTKKQSLINKINQNLEESQQQIIGLSKEIVTSKKKANDATRALTASKAQHDAKQKASATRILSLEKQLTELQETIRKSTSESQKALSRTKTEAQQTIDQIKSKATKDVAEAAMAVINFKRLFEEYKQEAVNAHRKSAATEQSIQQVKQKLKQATETLEATRKEKSGLDFELNALKLQTSSLKTNLSQHTKALSRTKADAKRAKLASMINDLGALKTIKTCLGLRQQMIQLLKNKVEQAGQRAFSEQIGSQLGALLNTMFFLQSQAILDERKASSQDPFKALETKLLNRAKSIAKRHDSTQTIAKPRPRHTGNAALISAVSSLAQNVSTTPIEQVNGFIEKLSKKIQDLEGVVENQSQAQRPEVHQFDAKTTSPSTPRKDRSNGLCPSGDFTPQRGERKAPTPIASPPTPQPPNSRIARAASGVQGENPDAKPDAKPRGNPPQ